MRFCPHKYHILGHWPALAKKFHFRMKETNRKYHWITATLAAYGSYKGRDLYHSQSNPGFELHLWLFHSSWQCQILNTVFEASDQTSSWTLCWILNHLSHNGNSWIFILKIFFFFVNYYFFITQMNLSHL